MQLQSLAKRVGFTQVCRVKALGKARKNLFKMLAGIHCPAGVAMQPDQAIGGAQLQG